MEDNILEKGVGTKEIRALKSAQVLITGVKVEPKEKNGKPIGKIVKVICKHPDKEEPIEIGELKYLKDDTVKYSGLWINEDDEGNIQKGSALAILLDFLKAETIKSLEGKEAPTDVDKAGYLCFKAYS